jgi:hypothetical protein
MKAKRACQCIILSLVIIGVPTQVQATAASGSSLGESLFSETHEGRKPARPGTANPNETARGMPPAGKARQEPVPRDRTQEIEERVQSGQVDQEEVSERLEELQSGSNPLSDETGTGEHASVSR